MATDDALPTTVPILGDETGGDANEPAAHTPHTKLSPGARRLADALSRVDKPTRTPPPPLMLARHRRRDQAFLRESPKGRGAT